MMNSRPVRSRLRLPQRRLLRLPVVVLLSYLAVVALAQLAGFALVILARVVGEDPRGGDIAQVRNLRRVDDKLWAGAQPEPADYRSLAAAGVVLVVDLRTGAADDRQVDDPAFLRDLGVRYARLPVPDGHAPSPDAVTRFVALVRAADGLVFVHCGGGVGRSTAMQAAYQAETGRDPRWWDLVAIGPVTLEQGWFIAAAGDDGAARPNVVVRRISELLDAPRRGFSRLRAAL